MKRFLLMFSLLFGLQSYKPFNTVSAPNACLNYVDDGGFENSPRGDWYTDTPNNTFVNSDSKYIWNGSRSLVLTTKPIHIARAYQRLNIGASATSITFTGYVLPFLDTGENAYVQIWSGNGSQLIWGKTVLDSEKENGWYKVSGNLPLEAIKAVGGDILLLLGVDHDNDGESNYSVVFFDNISIVICDPTTTTPLRKRAFLPFVQNPERGIVTNVVDGDTFDISLPSGVKRVRLIGIDAPESGVCYYQESKEALKQLLLNRDTWLEKDISETDDYGRLLRYARLPGYDLTLNEYLVARGYAFVKSYPPDVKYDAQFAYALSWAKANNQGGWSACTGTPSVPAPTPATPAPEPTPPPNTNCDPSYPDVCIPPPPPYLDCADVKPLARFRVIPPDPHNFDGDHDGIGCE